MPKLVKVWIPISALKNFKIKQEEMQKRFQQLTGKERRIPMTKVYLAVSQNPIFVLDNQLIEMIKRGKFRRF